MKKTLFYLVCLIAVATLIAGCTAIPGLKLAQTSQSTQASTAAASPTTGPSPTATISTPSVVTVGAPATAIPSATITPKPSKTPKPTATAKYAPVVKSANFVKTIGNPYFPLTPGTSFLYDGTKGTSKLISQVIVTKNTRKIMGVACIEVDTSLTADDKLAQKTVDWYAQDKDGNVWFFGEDLKAYSPAGKVTSTKGSWLAGTNGALPGIIMQAVPTANLTYREDYYAGHNQDMAQVVSLTETVTTPAGSYTNVVEITETSPLTPKVSINKWYAQGVGLVQVQMTQGGNEQLQLTEVKK